jgi:antitoxin component YwqK of YwqJK toxin-antitoxin module
LKLASIGLPAIQLLLSSAQAQSYQERDMFVGSVKSMRIELLYLDDEGSLEGRKRHLSALRAYDINRNLTLYEDFYIYGKASYGKDTYTYDSAGKLVEKAHEINGSVYKTTYTYNKSEQLFKEISVRQVKEHIYNLEGRLIEIRHYDIDGINDGKVVISYDGAGRQIGRIFYNRNGSPEGNESRTYDAEGRLRKEVTRYGTKTYNEKGQLITEISGKDATDPNYRKVVYEYDDKGHLVKEETYKNKGLSETTLYAYEFDSVGNWTKQMTTVWKADGKKRAWETYRIITYY